MPLSIVILAAGKGTRMRSSKAKVLHSIGGRPLLKHVIDTAKQLQPSGIHVVVGHGAEQVKTQLGNEPVSWVEQHEQNGTGHAVQQAMPHIPAEDDVLVLYGDVPLTRMETLRAVVESLEHTSLCLLTANLENPHGYGRIVRDDAGQLKAIVEQKDADNEQLAIKEINTGILAAKASMLLSMLDNLRCDNAQGEYYLTDVIGMCSDANEPMSAITVSDLNEISGINDRQQLATMERVYQSNCANRLMADGVTLLDPARIDVRGELHAGNDSVIDVNCIFTGDNTIGCNVVIGANCVIENSTIADDVTIEANCVIENATIGAHCSIGPFARVRPGTVLSEKAKLGNFVETKNSHIGVGSKVNHLSYVGDSEVAENVNIGAGVITANYDGANKHKTKIGNNSFVGSNSVLIAPIDVGEGCTVGAGSTVSKDVGDGELVFTRAKAKNVKNWQRPTKSK